MSYESFINIEVIFANLLWIAGAKSPPNSIIKFSKHPPVVQEGHQITISWMIF